MPLPCRSVSPYAPAKGKHTGVYHGSSEHRAACLFSYRQGKRKHTRNNRNKRNQARKKPVHVRWRREGPSQRGDVMIEAEATVSKEGAASHGPRAPLETGKGERDTDSHPEPQKEHTLTIGLVISETARLSICVVLSLYVCDNLLQQQ